MSRNPPHTQRARANGTLRAWLGWGAIAATFALTLLASSPLWPNASGVLELIPGKDKTGHLVIMGGLAAACVLAFAGRRWRGRELGAALILALVALAVTVDEVIQAAVPSRTFDLVDLAASLAGVVMIGGIAAFVQKRRAPGRV